MRGRIAESGFKNASRYRKFAEVAVSRLAFVKGTKALGFSLEEIRELLVIQHERTGACASGTIISNLA
jgi:DNA-binding transcriptional MerR regulator